jgi:hypothetical protein
MLAGTPYAPVLHTRSAEMKALRNLESSAKDRMFPLVVASPWPNAKKMEKVWQKIDEAFGQRRYVLDLDTGNVGGVAGSEVRSQFETLKSAGDDFGSYFELLKDLNSAAPCLQGVELKSFRKQALRAAELGRGLVIRFRPVEQRYEILQAIKIACEFVEDVVLWYDLGWSDDLLINQIKALADIRLISNEFNNIDIVLCGSSFPNAFSRVGSKAKVVMNERLLFNAVRRGVNSENLYYGDWGSARPRAEPTPMTPIARIDIANSSDWSIYRSSEGETYVEIARRMLAESDWAQRPNTWAKRMVEWTAAAKPDSIKAATTATAVRINDHLFRQALQSGASSSGGELEPFEDL